jgi:hypothetical protein
VVRQGGTEHSPRTTGAVSEPERRTAPARALTSAASGCHTERRHRTIRTAAIAPVSLCKDTGQLPPTFLHMVVKAISASTRDGRGQQFIVQRWPPRPWGLESFPLRLLRPVGRPSIPYPPHKRARHEQGRAASEFEKTWSGAWRRLQNPSDRYEDPLVMRRSGVRFSSQAPCLGPKTPVWPTNGLQRLDDRHRTRAFTGPLAASSLRRPGPGYGQAEAAQPVVCRRPSGARGRQAGGREEAGQSGGRRRARRVRRRRQRQKTTSPPAVGWPGARWILPDEASPVRGPRCWRR